MKCINCDWLTWCDTMIGYCDNVLSPHFSQTIKDPYKEGCEVPDNMGVRR